MESTVFLWYIMFGAHTIQRPESNSPWFTIEVYREGRLWGTSRGFQY